MKIIIIISVLLLLLLLLLLLVVVVVVVVLVVVVVVIIVVIVIVVVVVVELVVVVVAVSKFRKSCLTEQHVSKGGFVRILLDVLKSANQVKVVLIFFLKGSLILSLYFVVETIFNKELIIIQRMICFNST